jgi:hypothetical protein
LFSYFIVPFLVFKVYYVYPLISLIISNKFLKCSKSLSLKFLQLSAKIFFESSFINLEMSSIELLKKLLSVRLLKAMLKASLYFSPLYIFSIVKLLVRVPVLGSKKPKNTFDVLPSLSVNFLYYLYQLLKFHVHTNNHHYLILNNL